MPERPNSSMAMPVFAAPSRMLGPVVPFCIAAKDRPDLLVLTENRKAFVLSAVEAAASPPAVEEPEGPPAPPGLVPDAKDKKEAPAAPDAKDKKDAPATPAPPAATKTGGAAVEEKR